VRELGIAPERIAVVPHGSYVGVYPSQPDAEAARHATREELGLPGEAFVFLAFGHLRGYKEIGLLLEAFAQVADERARLLIAGLPLDEQATKATREAARRDPRIRLVLEFVPDERVAELFAAADAAVLCRGDGGTSGALILALSLGTPVVAAAVPTATELLQGERAGWLFAPGDKASLSGALERAASDRSAAAKGAAARAIADEIPWEGLAPRYAELLRGALEHLVLLRALDGAQGPLAVEEDVGGHGVNAEPVGGGDAVFHSLQEPPVFDGLAQRAGVGADVLHGALERLPLREVFAAAPVANVHRGVEAVQRVEAERADVLVGGEGAA